MGDAGSATRAGGRGAGAGGHAMTSLPGRLYEKWQRDRSLPVGRRVAKVRGYVSDVARARLYLRGASEVAGDVRVVGRPIIENDGRLVIGARCILRSTVAPIEITTGADGTIVIGPDTHINSGLSVCAYDRVEIGRRVEIAPYVSIYDSNFHELYDRNAHPEPRPVVIEDDVWLCTKSTVLPGVRIGRGSVVSAHALVTHDVPPFTVVSGVPAQVVKELDPERFVVSDPQAE